MHGPPSELLCLDGFCRVVQESSFGAYYRNVTLGKGYRMKWIQLVLAIINGMGPELRAALADAIKAWEANASKTPTPLDDFLVAIVKLALGIQ